MIVLEIGDTYMGMSKDWCKMNGLVWIKEISQEIIAKLLVVDG